MLTLLENQFTRYPSKVAVLNKLVHRQTPLFGVLSLPPLTMPNSQHSPVNDEDIELSDAPPCGDSDVEEEVTLKASSNGVSKSPTKIEDMFHDDDDVYGMSGDDDEKLFEEMEFVPIGPQFF